MNNINNNFVFPSHMEESLSKEIAEKVRIYKENVGVEAIYMNSYRNNSGTAIIDLVLIGDKELNIKEFPYAKIYFDDKTLKFNIYSDDAKNYNLEMKSYAEKESCIDLFNGHILFDRDNKYKKLKKDIYQKYLENNLVNSRTFSNKIEFNPALVLTKKMV